ncbi:hypothetical protein C8035_v001395 [Colletotrichum spinosum]|uniref:Uncharacterized protein n=2 Tax=Colletotrichum orbiculare species complex TaxID=2707354 RepID=A0A4R8RX43_COLTR|nr:hypothetical protein C8035_v001395 [Colletotrichum spinosum]TDZ74104.1 hypothetical protein CTRI78_v001028 [Colletotrichum trifolii]
MNSPSWAAPTAWSLALETSTTNTLPATPWGSDGSTKRKLMVTDAETGDEMRPSRAIAGARAAVGSW